MYRGLPIVTNKIPENERNGIPHHLLDQIGLEEDPWTVNEFVAETSRIVKEIQSRGKLPIVVGGTNYYVFSLIFEESILEDSDGDATLEGKDLVQVPGNSDTADLPDLSILDEPTEVLLAKLKELDPVMASSWHPKDRRKILRSLEICLKSGRKASEIYEEQRFARDQITAESSVPKMRFEPLIFWLEAESSVLKARLDTRVDVMIRDGLLDEVKKMKVFADESTREGLTLDKGKGIWIAIGYKELGHWLDACEKNSVDPTALLALKDAGIEDIKAGTRQYAKRQNRWIRIRLAQHLKSAGMLKKLFLLDGTNLSAWDEMVADPSEKVTADYLSGLPLPENTSMSRLASETFEHMQSQDMVSNRQARFCETCQKTLMTEKEWIVHVKSNRHKKVLEGIRKRAQQQSWQQRQVTADV